MDPQKQQKTEEDLKIIKSTFENHQELSYQVFEHMPLGICVTNENGIFTDVNATYCDIYGYTRNELIGKSFTTVVPAASQQELTRLHDEFLDNKYELKGKWTVKSKQGEFFEIITNAAYLYDKDQDERRKMTLVVKAQEMEETIKRLATTIEILENKIKTQDIANRLAEHDMRNRISSMVSIAEILKETKLSPDQLKWVNMLKNIGNDTLRLLSSAKDYAKMERGEYQPKISEFDLVSIIVNETGDLKDLINLRQVDINVHIDGQQIDPTDHEILFKGDEFYIQHLFQNLLSNAIEASPEKETVDIYLESSKNRLEVKVHNQGMIPVDIQDTFFEKYTSSGKEQGTGLGTYIAKMIAELHGGSISFITSKASGTTIVVQLPQLIEKA
ncbi:PAS domain-containing sensor histidine kinase [Nonlabens xiamenensis]|uniref:PAS domain-containing sensor histidine kinase n=1 Tax=Nonlabens xiamenensis TaxID=2341043 RepID=UPI000F60538D|nr:PAS domain-containing sensor histidine kinase [Nonlabens xiamenensis]